VKPPRSCYNLPMSTALALTYHDPEGLLAAQLERTLPTLQQLFPLLAVNASYAAHPSALARLREAGAHLRQNTQQEDQGPPKIGRSRRRVVALAVEQGAEHVLYCDADRALHWAEFYPDELRQAAQELQGYDLTVLGRTPRAFASHPRFQVDTERIINHIFGLAYGLEWDVTAGARGLSARAARAISAGSQVDGLSTDVAWPLFLASLTGYSLGYLEAEGLEYETADRYPQEVAAEGGLEAWRDQLDSDPQRWVLRLALALEEAQAVLPYLPVPQGQPNPAGKLDSAGPLGPFSNTRD
jgi:hypothetical protein